MSEVVLRVGGRPYTVTCADGEEERLQQLAAVVDLKLASLGGNLPPGDAKTLLFAALILADELDEARKPTAAQLSPAADETIPLALEKLADRIEAIAQKLESAAASA